MLGTSPALLSSRCHMCQLAVWSTLAGGAEESSQGSRELLHRTSSWSLLPLNAVQPEASQH